MFVRVFPPPYTFVRRVSRFHGAATSHAIIVRTPRECSERRELTTTTSFPALMPPRRITRIRRLIVAYV